MLTFNKLQFAILVIAAGLFLSSCSTLHNLSTLDLPEQVNRVAVVSEHGLWYSEISTSGDNGVGISQLRKIDTAKRVSQTPSWANWLDANFLFEVEYGVQKWKDEGGAGPEYVFDHGRLPVRFGKSNGIPWQPWPEILDPELVIDICSDYEADALLVFEWLRLVGGSHEQESDSGNEAESSDFVNVNLTITTGIRVYDAQTGLEFDRADIGNWVSGYLIEEKGETNIEGLEEVPMLVHDTLSTYIQALKQALRAVELPN